MKIFSKFLKSSTSKERKINEITLDISDNLKEFVKDELLPGLNISPEYFWSSFEEILNSFSQKNKELLDKRKDLQEKIDDWHIENKNKDFKIDQYKKFLTDLKLT